MIETALTTGTSAALPTFKNARNDIPEAVGTAIFSMESSFIIASGTIIYDACRRNMTLKEELFHGD